MKRISYLAALAVLFGSAATAPAQGWDRQTLVVTTSNTTKNQLLVYNTSNQLIQTVATGGEGGVSGNAGGIASSLDRLAAVNFGSQNVSIFERFGNGFRVGQIIPTASSPVSVAFAHDHLYILGTTKIE